MLTINEMPVSSELRGKIKEFAINACISGEQLDDLDNNQLQQLADMYETINCKDIILQNLDGFFEGIKNHYSSTDDALLDILEMICETSDLKHRLLLKEIYYLFKGLGTDSGNKMLALRDLVIYHNFNEKITGLHNGLFIKETGEVK
ncbi:hypothetical protein ACP6L2_03890 [Sphingobacterium lactis]|uniref:hypothetical protein n=1 Tax=Sphingobacterium lactis TaxID=797291 RepID=UPI003F81E256